MSSSEDMKQKVSDSFSEIKSRWNKLGLSPEDSVKAKMLLIGGLVFIFAWIVVSGDDNEENQERIKNSRTTDVRPSIDRNVLETSAYQTNKVVMERLREKLEIDNAAFQETVLELVNAKLSGFENQNNEENKPKREQTASTPTGKPIAEPNEFSKSTQADIFLSEDGSALIQLGKTIASIDSNGFIHGRIKDGDVYINGKRIGVIINGKIVSNGKTIGKVSPNGIALIDPNSFKRESVANNKNRLRSVQRSPRVPLRDRNQRLAPPTKNIVLAPQAPKKYVGGINLQSISYDETIPSEKKNKRKNKKKASYLPSGTFMAATLISGINAPAASGAENVPIPALLRIKDLAVLPNRIKANLKGCLALAEGFGDLSLERVRMRLLRISCIALDGASVIDQEVVGWIADQDGKGDLKGRVVYKAGAVLARTGLSGILSGFGEAFRASAQITSVTGLGAVSVTDPNQVAKTALATGATKAAEKFSDFYLDLARQTFPVIEVGAMKEVTIIIKEGVDLEIKTQCLDPQDCE